MGFGHVRSFPEPRPYQRYAAQNGDLAAPGHWPAPNGAVPLVRPGFVECQRRAGTAGFLACPFICLAVSPQGLGEPWQGLGESPDKASSFLVTGSWPREPTQDGAPECVPPTPAVPAVRGPKQRSRACTTNPIRTSGTLTQTGTWPRPGIGLPFSGAVPLVRSGCVERQRRAGTAGFLACPFICLTVSRQGLGESPGNSRFIVGNGHQPHDGALECAYTNPGRTSGTLPKTAQQSVRPSNLCLSLLGPYRWYGPASWNASAELVRLGFGHVRSFAEPSPREGPGESPETAGFHSLLSPSPSLSSLLRGSPARASSFLVLPCISGHGTGEPLGYRYPNGSPVPWLRRKFRGSRQAIG